VAEEKINEEKKEIKKTNSNKKIEKKGAKPVNPVTRYFRETRGELRKVTWPTRQESWRLTAIVIAVSTAMAFFLWFWDFVFSQSIQWLIEVLVA
jgi:preprotein translocase subunit SecE